MSQLSREIKITEDGSTTIFVPGLGEHYHSHFGAIQESKHIFIESALMHIDKPEISILEFGLGSALNAIMSNDYAALNNKVIHYYGIEKYPLIEEEYSKMNFENSQSFLKIHKAEWESEQQINGNFYITKVKADFAEASLPINTFDVVYFDAFAPDVQAHLWTKEIFEKTYAAMKQGSVLTTYTVKGVIRRLLKEVGFEVEKIPGPIGKREITRAWKR